MANSGSQKAIIFNWRPFNISTYQAIPYNILASNCGICPTTTNLTTVTCTDVPIDATNCHFTLIPTICGRVSPSLGIYLDVELIKKGLYCVIGMHLLQYMDLIPSTMCTYYVQSVCDLNCVHYCVCFVCVYMCACVCTYLCVCTHMCGTCMCMYEVQLKFLV